MATYEGIIRMRDDLKKLVDEASEGFSKCEKISSNLLAASKQLEVSTTSCNYASSMLDNFLSQLEGCSLDGINEQKSIFGDFISTISEYSDHLSEATNTIHSMYDRNLDEQEIYQEMSAYVAPLYDKMVIAAKEAESYRNMTMRPYITEEQINNKINTIKVVDFNYSKIAAWKAKLE